LHTIRFPSKWSSFSWISHWELGLLRMLHLGHEFILMNLLPRSQSVAYFTLGTEFILMNLPPRSRSVEYFTLGAEFMSMKLPPKTSPQWSLASWTSHWDSRTKWLFSSMSSIPWTYHAEVSSPKCSSSQIPRLTYKNPYPNLRHGVGY